LSTLIKVTGFRFGVILLVFSCSGSVLAHGTHTDLIQKATFEIKRRPGDHAGWLDRAQLHIKQGDVTAGFNDIKVAETIAGEIEVAYVLGLYHVAIHHYAAAVKAFSQYLTRYPEHTASIYNRARAHKELGIVTAAISDYRYLLSVSNRPSPDYYLELARIESSVSPDGTILALKTLDRGIDKLGLLVSLQAVAIEYELSRKNYKKALARHESLKPWLGKTDKWLQRLKQLQQSLLTD